jgi:pyruvate dehydrogenase E2 component (dihydrolipoamide acetyltransferase)
MPYRHHTDPSDNTFSVEDQPNQPKQNVTSSIGKATMRRTRTYAASPSAPTSATATLPQPGTVRGTTAKMSRLRKVIAQRMVQSLQISAQLTTVVEVDMTAVSQLRDRVKHGFQEREGLKLSFLPFIAKAALESLREHPKVNASIDMEKGEIVYHGAEHLAVAVDTERGLFVPVIRDAGELSLTELTRKIADVATRTRENKITPEEMSGGTFTLTNTGSRGALFDTPIINQPQVAILGAGAVVKRVEVVSHPTSGDAAAIRSMMFLALSYDHRLVDGADAARFLTTVKARLETADFAADLAL